jgi:molybdenum cofactor biosynthesis protein MoaC
MNELTHTDSSGKAKMVDVSSKSENERTASAKATVYLNSKVFELIKNNEIQKGDVLTVAKIAGIQGAKKTSELIPLCHNIFISNIDINFQMNHNDYSIDITSTTKTIASTGIEMEALTAVSIASLTIYDMCKAVDKSITIGEIKLISKTGGKSNNYSS